MGKLERFDRHLIAILAMGVLDNLVYKFSVDEVMEALERKKIV